MQQKQPNPDDAQQLSPDSQPAGSKPASGEGDIGLSSGQLMLALQLGIFLPFLGPLLAIGIGAMNRQHKDGRLIMLGGLCLILLQLATLALIWGYIASRPVQGPMN